MSADYGTLSEGHYDGHAVAKRLAVKNRASGDWVVDNPPSPDFPIYTRGNIGEVFPDVVKPFSWSLWGIPYSEAGWREALVRLGAFDMEEFPSDAMAMLSCFGGYGYLNVTASRIFGVRAPGLTPEAIDLSFFGETAGVPPYAPKDTDVSPVHETRLTETIGWVLTTRELPELDAMRARTLELRDARPDLAAMSDEDLLARTHDLARDWWHPYWVRHIMATYHSMIPAGAVGTVCAAVGKPELAADILTSDRPVDSARPALALWEMSRKGPEPSPAAWTSFMAEYGFRGPNEWEMGSVVWDIDDTAARAALRGMAAQDDSQSPTIKKAARDAVRGEALATVSAMLEGDPDTLGQFQLAAESCAVFFAARERTRANCARIVHEMRLPMVELGRRFVKRGHFQRPQDFALLTYDEWVEVLHDAAGARDLVNARRAQEAELAALVPPFIVNGEVPPLSGWEARGAGRDTLGVGESLQGQPGCAGTVRGVARVILDASDPGDLEPGDILIAQHTDPSWTPIFAACSGVVVNVGATISHAVIVARELGVPCVVSADGATDRIPHGCEIEVNGATGVVTRVS